MGTQVEKLQAKGVLRGIEVSIWSLGLCGSVDRVPACEPKGRRFDSHSGHTPGLQARAPVGGAQEETTLGCFSPSLSPFPSLKTNRQYL